MFGQFPKITVKVFPKIPLVKGVPEGRGILNPSPSRTRGSPFTREIKFMAQNKEFSGIPII